MKNKVDISDFKNEIAGLREMIGNIEADDKNPIDVQAQVPTQNVQKDFNSKEVAKLKEIIQKFPGVDETVQKILNDMKGMNLREMKENISKLFSITDTLATQEVVNGILDDLKALKILVDSHTFEIKELRDMLSASKNSAAGSSFN